MSSDQPALSTDPPDEHPRESESEHEFTPRPNNSNKPPWWTYGLPFVICCLLFINSIRIGKGNLGYYFYSLMGICISIILIQFIREFFKQHAQFSIKNLLILTFCVAVLCSIYSCYGYEIMVLVLVISYMILSIGYGYKTKSDESVQDHSADRNA